jgi:hypothetical protein
MSASSSLALPDHQAPQEDQAPLPLIRCPRCNIGVTLWWVSSTVKNPGRHYYKCQFHSVRVPLNPPQIDLLSCHASELFLVLFEDDL